jgi:diacylglycerol kinase family enzyme
MDGEIIPLDGGTVNGHLLLNHSSLGTDPHIVQEREAHQQAGRSQWFARCLTAISAPARYPRMTIHIRITGQVLVRANPIGFIGHYPDLGKGLKIGAPTCLDQGRLCVYVWHQTGRWGLLRLLRSRGTHERGARHGASSSRRQSWRRPLLQVLDSRPHPPHGGLQCYDAGFGHLDVGLGLWRGVRPHL